MVEPLTKEHFDYSRYEHILKGFRNFRSEVQRAHGNNQVMSEVMDWIIPNICIPNNILVAEGYGLYSREDILVLKLENARLKNESEEKILGIEKELQQVKKKIKEFKLRSYYVD